MRSRIVSESELILVLASPSSFSDHFDFGQDLPVL